MARVNYLSNKNLLIEIHNSKNSYSYFLDEKYGNYDHIVNDLKEINNVLIETIRYEKSKKLRQQEIFEQTGKTVNLDKLEINNILIDNIKITDLVWRVMDYSHIPLDNEKTKIPKNEKDKKIRVNFPPFKHYIIDDITNLTFKEVGRSHWKDGLGNGCFSQDHGKITNNLGKMYLKLVDRYGGKGNWCRYTYLDEMKAAALVQLIKIGLQFDESRKGINNTNNPFGYYTMVAQNAFTFVFNLEKRNQNIRDDILIMNNMIPSLTRQIDDEFRQKNSNDLFDNIETIPIINKKLKTGTK